MKKGSTDHQIYELPNGIRLVHQQVNFTKIVHCGFILDVGSRDEKKKEQGMAHFWEHMAFKGTQKRKAYHIINRLESVGGEMNAYTTKEKICFYASVLDRFFEKAVELLTDLTFFSVFPAREIEKEKQVILEEMAMYHDIPEDSLQDEFDMLLFPDQPLGRNILGIPECVSSFRKEDFLNFTGRNLVPGKIIFSVVGNISFDVACRLTEKYMHDLRIKNSSRKRIPAIPSYGNKKMVEREILRSHCAMGTPACSIRDNRRLHFFMLTNLLGGPAMNSRLNLELRERKGFVYSIDANFSPYSDTGIFAIYFGTEPKYLDRSVHLVHRELKKLRQKPLGSLQLYYAKEQLMGQLAMSEENYVSLMLMLGKSLLDLERIDTLEEIFNKIRNISAVQLQDLANEILPEDNFSYLYYKPSVNHGNNSR